MRFDNASIVVYYCLIQMNIINLGILAHIDAGKTSVTENLLFASGATEKCGCVDNGDTITDSMDIEKRRGITVRASTTSIIWNGVKCNIIDTPGGKSSVSCPLKPSDSAPLKHSTMPP